MKIFIATDVHGSAYWAQKVKEKFLASQCDVMVLLGDVYNHGPRNPFPQEYAPMRTAEIFSTLKDRLLVVKGNCDSEVDEMISDFDFLPQEALFTQRSTVFHSRTRLQQGQPSSAAQRGRAVLRTFSRQRNCGKGRSHLRQRRQLRSAQGRA